MYIAAPVECGGTNSAFKATAAWTDFLGWVLVGGGDGGGGEDGGDVVRKAGVWIKGNAIGGGGLSGNGSG